MAITFNIPVDAWLRTQDSVADIVELGRITPPSDGSLQYIKTGFYKNNCTGSFRIRLHTSVNYDRIYAASDWVDISDIPSASFVGNIRFDFNNTVLNQDKVYWVTIEASGYVRNADISYMSWVHDWPDTANVLVANWPNEFPIRMEPFYK